MKLRLKGKIKKYLGSKGGLWFVWGFTAFFFGGGGGEGAAGFRLVGFGVVCCVVGLFFF